jgi:hypothetical protein
MAHDDPRAALANRLSDPGRAYPGGQLPPPESAMGSELFATKWICDFCGAVTQAATIGLPPGWLSAWPGRAPVTATFHTADGRRFGDCCESCAQMSLTGLLGMLAGRVLP